MFEKIVKNYYKLFDEKLENGTLVVLIIALIIVLSGTMIKNNNISSYVKNSVLETTGSKPVPSPEIIEINGVKYQLMK